MTNTRKSAIAVALGAVLTFTLIACGEGEDAAEAEAPVIEVMPNEVTPTEVPNPELTVKPTQEPEPVFIVDPGYDHGMDWPRQCWDPGESRLAGMWARQTDGQELPFTLYLPARGDGLLRGGRYSEAGDQFLDWHYSAGFLYLWFAELDNDVVGVWSEESWAVVIDSDVLILTSNDQNYLVREYYRLEYAPAWECWPGWSFPTHTDEGNPLIGHWQWESGAAFSQSITFFNDGIGELDNNELIPFRWRSAAMGYRWLAIQEQPRHDRVGATWWTVEIEGDTLTLRIVGREGPGDWYVVYSRGRHND
ncbi:MAG: hypothetical protein FWD83_08215 [Promicromonosporaceae bacterium]|nr:hypothetical protein [Promicromonosporaceae bacterium]